MSPSYSQDHSRTLAVAEATSRNNNKLFPGEYFENFNFLQKKRKDLVIFFFAKLLKLKS
jgi:hypothetical protein